MTSPAIAPPNGSFSTKMPSLQLVIDSTSLGEFKTCPRRYWYRIVQGWVPRHLNIHLDFGLRLHQGREDYEGLKAQGWEHEEALRQVVHLALINSWDSALGKPWDSGHPLKNRFTLTRTLVWYLDAFGKDDALQTIRLDNGKPAVELSFKFDSGMTAVTGEPITFAGHLDRLATLGDDPYVCDLKTTASTLSPSYFAQFTPDNQFSLYTLAGRVAFHTPIAGVVVDGVQVGAGFSRFQRQVITRSPAQMDEWLEDTRGWLFLMAQMAETAHWPMNDKACHQYGGCPYRPVCSRPPSARERWLEADYTKSPWDPSVARGDAV